ncbi:Bug family tripartite tricarboxylate transporter substrate binding protein [Nocardioides caldifontis]|uniref:Bug family tripartite tricarboxylate transporter substrate binding protein n=1 Tax=Nocardioides caldifontis TaxID=2588938 RepID=UPI0011E067BB|nr:tripartite tricarboxylate transporter substrate-binding protein [Nocardioides caldifontis]
MTQHVDDEVLVTTPDPSTDPTPVDERSAPTPRTAGSIVAGFAALAVGVSVVGGDLLNPAASTTDGDYAGETVEMMIPLAEGGGTDTWARFVAAELTEKVPGSPGLAPVNDDGGEGILGTNNFMTSARSDGTEVLVSTASTVVPYLLDMPAVRYDFNELRPILANGTGAVVYARTGAGVKGVKDLVDRDEPLVFGGIAATSLDLTTMLAFDLLDADVTSTFGFEGRGPVNLALQRGEVDIDYQTTSSYGPAVEPLVKDGTAVPLFSLGQVDEDGEIVRDPNFPRLPTVVEVYEQVYGEQPDAEALETYRAILALTYTYQKALWVPEDTPDEAVELLRSTAEEMGQDPAFQKSAEEVLGGYPLDASPDLAERIGDAYRVDDDVREDVLELLETDYDITID